MMNIMNVSTFSVFLLVQLGLSSSLSGQVGINTNKPKSMLDVNGDMVIRDKIYVGGTDAVKGNPGVPKQVFTSQGDHHPPIWKTPNIPEVKDFNYYLIYNNVFEDETGVLLWQKTSSLLPEDYLMTNLPAGYWKSIAGLSGKVFKVSSTQNKAYFTFETVAHLRADEDGVFPATDFACGIFVDKKLKGIRTATVRQVKLTFPFTTVTMLIVTEGLAKGNHVVDVLCSRSRDFNNAGFYDLAIGRTVDNINLNDFMARSTLKVEVFEIPEEFEIVTP
ncbi:hypothetical protein [Chryseobacterium sp. HR92]|uniref:hypothetical protein n=1 Tax=Chryseobacterium sp. HR92 TaxID=3094839 RepID=UPI00388FFF36|nr:hypothetical protein SFA27_13510 [Chryseobacterium sp. HR92]